MNNDIQARISNFSEEITKLFSSLRDTVYSSVSDDLEEKLWGGLPSYYLGKNFVRLILFKDHINIEASAIIKYKDDLKEYKLTPKGMLQLSPNREIPTDVLKQAFKETLTN